MHPAVLLGTNQKERRIKAEGGNNKKDHQVTIYRDKK